MKRKLLWLSVLLGVTMSNGFAQGTMLQNRSNKGSVFLSFGTNKAFFGNSIVNNNLDITRIGADDQQIDNFKMHNVRGIDPKSMFDFSKMNIRAGYFINEILSVSFSYDKMSYQVKQDQVVTLSGEINQGSFAGTYYQNDPGSLVRLTEDVLIHNTTFQAFSLGLDVNDDYWISRNGKTALSFFAGLGLGVLTANSETTLFTHKSTNKGKFIDGINASMNFGTRLNIMKYVFLELAARPTYMSINNAEKGVNEDGQGFTTINHKMLSFPFVASIGVRF